MSDETIDVEKYHRLKSRLRTLQAEGQQLYEDYQEARTNRITARERFAKVERGIYKTPDDREAAIAQVEPEVRRAETIFAQADARLQEHRDEVDHLGSLVTRLDEYIQAHGIELPETSMVSSPGARRVGLRDRDPAA